MVKNLLGIITFSVLLMACGNAESQTNNSQISDDTNDHEEEFEKEFPENDENQSNPNDVVEVNETSMEVKTGSAETVIRNSEGQDQEIKVINYHITTYGIAYQLDELFGVPEVSDNQITYSSQYDDYEITVEVMEHTNLEKAVANLQERFEAEGYEESFEEGYELKSTPVEENGLIGKTQFYGDHPIKGYIAYEIKKNVVVITFQYPMVGADAIGPLLEDFRKSIHLQ